jgi:hypothetical protein
MRRDEAPMSIQPIGVRSAPRCSCRPKAIPAVQSQAPIEGSTVVGVELDYRNHRLRARLSRLSVVMARSAKRPRAGAAGEKHVAMLKAELGITQHQYEAWAAYVATVLSNRGRMEGARDAPFGSLADRLAALAAMQRASSRLYACLNTSQRDRAAGLLPLCCQPAELVAAA